jgi:hypothetical protein
MTKKKQDSWWEQKLNTFLKKLDHKVIEEYVTYLKSPGQIMWNNFMAGMARGFGFIFGMTVIVALFGVVIQHLGGLPVIGQIFQWIGEEIAKNSMYR